MAKGMMDPWVTVALFGAAIFGFAWLTPGGNREDRARSGSDPAYDQLLDELETENRELLDAVTKFKQEQDETVKGLVKQIQALERQMHALSTPRQAESAAETPAARQAEAEAMVGPTPPSPVREAELAAADVAVAAAAAAAHAELSQIAPAAPLSVRERYAELLALHRKGKSIEQIAKSVGMNKGEVQLILQLARREEEQFA